MQNKSEKKLYQQELEAQIDVALEYLQETGIFKSIQIITTAIDENERSIRCCRGKGDFYARLGATRAFLVYEDAQEKEEARANMMGE